MDLPSFVGSFKQINRSDPMIIYLIEKLYCSVLATAAAGVTFAKCSPKCFRLDQFYLAVFIFRAHFEEFTAPVECCSYCSIIFASFASHFQEVQIWPINAYL